MTRRTRSSGFVLLLVLVLILLAGGLLASVAWHSVAAAVQSHQAVAELQRRWAAASIQATLGPRAEAILDAVERGSTVVNGGRTRVRGLPELRVSFRLCETNYDVIITDEQAGVNANHLLARHNSATAQSLLSRLVRSATNDAPGQVRLRPTVRRTGDPGQPRSLPAIGSYSQVFESASPAALAGDDGIARLGRPITCWGDGRVTLHRAPADVIALVCDKAAPRDTIAAVITARDRNSNLAVSEILAGLNGCDTPTREGLAALLTDRSTCHGVWVIARGRDRSWYSLAISMTAPSPNDDRYDTVVERYTFQW